MLLLIIILGFLSAQKRLKESETTMSRETFAQFRTLSNYNSPTTLFHVEIIFDTLCSSNNFSKAYQNANIGLVRKVHDSEKYINLVVHIS